MGWGKYLPCCCKLAALHACRIQGNFSEWIPKRLGVGFSSPSCSFVKRGSTAAEHCKKGYKKLPVAFEPLTSDGVSDMWLLKADSSKTTVLMGLRYRSPALLENTVVAIFPEEVAARNYTCLAVEKELKEQLWDRSSTFPSCWPALQYRQGDRHHWKSVGAQMQLLLCPVVLYRVGSQSRKIKMCLAVIFSSICPRKQLFEWSLYV